MMKIFSFLLLVLAICLGCQSSEEIIVDEMEVLEPVEINERVSASELFSGVIDFDNLPNYAGQTVPNYINEDNTNGNDISDEVALLGRVLFYDKQLSADNTIACASCHKQALAFGDNEVVSQGVNGTTSRHSMRLINTRFSRERKFFWDERANTLEDQTTMPIQDHIEMGFSGTEGDEDVNDLIDKLAQCQYMRDLFKLAYGSEEITEQKMQLALAQFIRSIQSFDAKYDLGISQTNNRDIDFPNFTTEENLGKALFMGRTGCDRCHRAPGFELVNDSGNNGVITTVADDGTLDLTITRAPTLRDIFNPEGEINGPLMHTGSFATMEEVIHHYADITQDPLNTNLDIRLRGRGGKGQQLNLEDEEVAAIVAFVATLSGSAVYTADKWSDPFPI